MFSAMVLGYALLRLVTFSLDRDWPFPDTRSYVEVAAAPLGSPDFLAGPRPLTVPLVYKALGLVGGPPYDRVAVGRVTAFQFGLSLLSWLFLACVVVRSVRRRWLQPAAFALVLLFGSAIDIAQWDRSLLSESISASLFALLVAGWVWGIVAWTGGGSRSRSFGRRLIYIFATCLIMLLFAFTRDAHAYFLIGFGILAVGSAIVTAARTRARVWEQALLGLCMAGIFILQTESADRGRRWWAPFKNVFYLRIFRVEEPLAFFASRGLPLDAINEDMSLGLRPFLKQLEENRSAKPLEDWLLQNGREVYLQYLIAHPLRTLSQPVKRLDAILSPDSSEFRHSAKPDPSWLAPLGGVLFLESVTILGALMLASLGGVLYWILLRRRWSNMWALPLGLLALVYPMALLVWHGDAVELERHSFQVALQFRLAVWLLLIYLLDQAGELPVWSWRAEARAA